MELPVDPVNMSVEEILENLQAGHRRAMEAGPQMAMEYLQRILRDTIDLPSTALMVIYDLMSEAQAELQDWDGCAASLTRAQEERKRARTGLPPRTATPTDSPGLPLGWLSERSARNEAQAAGPPAPGAQIRRTFTPEDFAGLLPPQGLPAPEPSPAPGTRPPVPVGPIVLAPAQPSATWPAPAAVAPVVQQEPWPSAPAPRARSGTPAARRESPRKLCRTCGRDVTHRSRTKDPKTNTYLCSRCFDEHVRKAGRGLPRVKRPALWIVVLSLAALAIAVVLGLTLGGRPS